MTMDHSDGAGGWADKAYQLVGGGERGQREYERLKRMPRAARREAYRALERQVGGGADAPQQSDQEQPTQQPGGEGSGRRPWWKGLFGVGAARAGAGARAGPSVGGEAARARRVSEGYNMRYWLAGQAREGARGARARVGAADRYLSYEQWNGGFNNVRMSLEMAAALAFALNRTLVWPPGKDIYLRGKGGMDDYYDRSELSAVLRVVSYDDFARDVGLDRSSAVTKSPPPPKNAPFARLIGAPGVTVMDKARLGGKIGSQTVVCVPRCPKGPGDDPDDGYKRLQHYANGDMKTVDAAEFDTTRVLHIREVLLGNFYNFLWFRTSRVDAAVKRMVRDHIHFREDIVRRAEAIIDALGGHFSYSCMHVRRNDFQFKEAWVSAEAIVSNTRGLLRKGETLYIATDDAPQRRHHSVGKISFDPAKPAQANHSWFAPLSNEYPTRFLSNFKGRLDGRTPPRQFASIEQLVCARARVFVGTYLSTMTSYVHRLRGYMADVPSKQFLYIGHKYPHDYRRNAPHAGLGRTGPTWGVIKGGHPFWGREYKEAWEDSEVSFW